MASTVKNGIACLRKGNRHRRHCLGPLLSNSATLEKTTSSYIEMIILSKIVNLGWILAFHLAIFDYNLRYPRFKGY